MDDVTKEIRQALLGNLATKDKRLVVSDLWATKYWNGLVDGFGSVLFLGVMRRGRWYRMPGSSQQIMEQAGKAMMDMGRMMRLRTLPDAEAVYCTYLLNSPVVLTFLTGEQDIAVHAYAGRGISGLIAVFRTFRKLEKKMPEEFVALEPGEQRQKTVEEKERLRQEEFARREARKQAREESKKEKDLQKGNGKKHVNTTGNAAGIKSTNLSGGKKPSNTQGAGNHGNKKKRKKKR